MTNDDKTPKTDIQDNSYLINSLVYIASQLERLAKDIRTLVGAEVELGNAPQTIQSAIELMKEQERRDNPPIIVCGDCGQIGHNGVHQDKT